MTFDLAEAEQLAALVAKSGAVFAVSHNYTGYPLVRMARQMILSGELGEIQAVRSCYIKAGCGRDWRRATRSKPRGEPIPASPARRVASATSRRTPTTSAAT